MDEGAPRGLSSSPSGSLDLLGGGEPRPQDLGCWVGLSASLVKSHHASRFRNPFCQMTHTGLSCMKSLHVFP